MRPFVLTFLLCAALLAGCATHSKDASVVPAPVANPDWALRAIYGAKATPDDVGTAPDHDHADREAHKGLSSANFRVLGHDPLPSAYFQGNSAGTSYCGDVAAEGPRQLAVVHSFATVVALTVIDVTDRAAPKELGELVLPFEFTYDVAIFQDGKYAVIAGNPDLKVDGGPPADNRVPFSASWRDACGNEKPVQAPDYVPYGYSAILVDLSDPTTPVVADFYEYPAGRNVHSISTATIDGTRYVATSGLMALPCTLPSISGNPVPNPLPCEPAVPRFGNALSHFDFLTVEETPDGARLAPYLIYTPTDQTHLDPSLLYLSNGHTDATIEKHPITNQTLAYLADWDGGFHIIRLDGPAQGTPLATWGQSPGGDPTQMKGHLHSVAPVPGLRGGKHYIVVGQEVIGRPTGRPTGQIAILDVTNPSYIIRAAKWTLPIDVLWEPSQGELYSTHYPILVGDTLYVSLYHGGVWAADASPQNWPDLPSIGAFIPDGDPAGTPVSGGPTPEVLEVLSLGDGDLVVFDGTTGVYTVQFTPNDPHVTPATPWADNPWIG